MYVNINGTTVTNVTDRREDLIELNKPYREGKNVFVFVPHSQGVEVRSELKGVVVYRRLLQDGDYIVTGLYVDKITKMSREYRELYNALINLDIDFTLTTHPAQGEYLIYLNCYVEVGFKTKIDIEINKNSITQMQVEEILDIVHKLMRVNTHRVYTTIKGDDLTPLRLVVNKETIDMVEDIANSSSFQQR